MKWFYVNKKENSEQCKFIWHGAIWNRLSSERGWRTRGKGVSLTNLEWKDIGITAAEINRYALGVALFLI